MKSVLAIFLALFPSVLIADLLEETLTDQSGIPLAGILVRATNNGEVVEARSDVAGTFRLDLEGGPWIVEVDETELLARGYFCVPGFVFPGGEPFIQAVPLSPDLTLNSTANNNWFVSLNFDWLTEVEPQVARQCRIERSEDGINWEPLGTVLLTNPPIQIVDPNDSSQKAFYRAADVGGLLLVPVETISFIPFLDPAG